MTNPSRSHSPAHRRPAIAAIIALATSTAAAHADVVTLWPVADATLYQDPAGATASGAGTAMFAGRNSQSMSAIRRAILRFDLATAVPAGATILSASLRLYNDAANAGPADIALHRAAESWTEGASLPTGGQGSGAPATPGDTTWIHRSFPATAWSTPGGAFSPVASAVTPVAAPGFATWTGLAPDVQSFLNDPAANLGWFILGDETTASSARRFATREAAIPEHRPVLTIEFTPIPAPGAAAAFLAASLPALRRSRSRKTP